ncbi:uncharacterized protein [Euphorbia lathyris]|uniref:uncharacterized protein n=1 Tax=Euphorbia lathyris TaxID=212925 RepID=UPI0033131712
MASLPMSFVPPVRVYYAAAKGSSASGGSIKEEKGLLDFVLGKLTKQDQFYETDPILQRSDDKTPTPTGTGTGTSSGRKNSVSVPQKKKNGGGGSVFGGLFAKK